MQTISSAILMRKPCRNAVSPATPVASPVVGTSRRASVPQGGYRGWTSPAGRRRWRRSVIAGIVAGALVIGTLGWLLWSQLPAIMGSRCTTNARTGLGGTPAAFGGPSEVSGNLVTLDQCLQYVDIHLGSGWTDATVKVGDQITIEYTGWLTNGTKFASVPSPGLTFTVGQGQVIAGLDRGVIGMQYGGERRVIIPPALGYGAQGDGLTVPPNWCIR